MQIRRIQKSDQNFSSNFLTFINTSYCILFSSPLFPLALSRIHSILFLPVPQFLLMTSFSSIPVSFSYVIFPLMLFLCFSLSSGWKLVMNKTTTARVSNILRDLSRPLVQDDCVHCTQHAL